MEGKQVHDPEQMAGPVVLMQQVSEIACVTSIRTSPLDGVELDEAMFARIVRDTLISLRPLPGSETTATVPVPL